MRRMNVEIVVGLFLVAGLASALWLAVRMGGARLAPHDAYPLVARFGSVSGLREGAQVELAGVPVGRVARIRLDESTYEAVVEMSVANGVRVQEDAIASIRTQGIIGDRFVKISPGGSPEILAPGMEIVDTEPAISLEELIAKYIFERGE